MLHQFPRIIGIGSNRLPAGYISQRLNAPIRIMKIAFVLGAGASRTFGYPIGVELRSQILNQLRRRNGILWSALRDAGNNDDEIEEFRADFYHSGYETIDAFLSGQRSNLTVRRVGKQAIVKMITVCEKDDALFDLAPRHWYYELVRFLREKREFVDREKIGFFTFNYDLSLDYFLYRSLKAGGGFSESTLLDFLRGNIVHVHGSAGSLHWQKRGENVREYGKSVSPDELPRLANDIITTHESSELGKEESERLASAETIVFLGFGFAESNLGKLNYSSLVSRDSRTIIASTFGDPALKERLTADKKIAVRDMDAYGVIEELLRKLAVSK